MASGEREFEEQLEEAGNRLLQPPSSVDELLPLLDQVENFLSRVEQSPLKSMQTALSPSMKALVADKPLRHPDVDVKVAVASCISEITRITAPDAPYDDDQMKASDAIEYDSNLIGKKVKVWWPDDDMFYEGVIDGFDPVKKKHKVSYTDGDEEILNLRDERWELVSGNSESDGEQAAECQSPDPSSDMHKKKKAKTNPEPSAKQGKREGSRGGEASSSKSKGAATKSGRKSKDDTKVDGKLKDNTSKSGAKSKDNSQKSSGKSVVDASKTTGKSKDVDASTPKSSIKFKLDSPKAATKDTPKTTTKDTPKTATKDTPKTATKSKGKASKSGNKSNANGSGKAKAGSAKVKETEGKEKSTETVKTPKSAKGKSPDTLKGQETGAKSGKKRRRGGAKS